MKVFHARGFLENKKVPRRGYPNQYDGNKLDELTIVATVESREEVDALIKYLQIHKWCFDKEVSEG